MTDETNRDGASSRRAFVRRVAYTAPVLLTLPAAPAIAQVGSASECDASSPFIDTCEPPPTDEYGCRDYESPTFSEDGEFLGCDS